jgi:hypothetical protein
VKKFLSDHPTLRGFLIIGAIVLLIMVLNLYTALATVGALLRIAFFLAIAFFIYLVWRERREDIALWPRRAYVAFYGAALLLVAAFGVFFWRGATGPDAAAFLVIIVLSVFSMIRVWRDQHRYG